MPVRIDHLGLPSRTPEASARWFSSLFALGEPRAGGPDRDMFEVELAPHHAVIFAPADAPAPHHVAFRVDRERFDAIVARLRAEHRAFGNDPGDTTNGLTQDDQGDAGRVYFLSPDGHLLEVVT